ncbi:MAG TPA: lytic transglycosylase domain-containing protein [Thermoanaerobaculia bacterium]|nr:lytic transglycosylase domain-containing protein [Thermoanaerobaculia bacterium]
MNPKRVPFTVLATIFLVISFKSTPSDTAIPDPLRLPDSPPESQALQDLANWVVQARTGTSSFHAISQGDLDAALAGDPSEMKAFPEEDAEAARREVLAGLPFGSQIWRTAQKHRVDGLLVAAVVEAESRFSPHAVSPKGAMGLMQILPSTGGLYGTPDLLDPYTNLESGTRYLSWLLREFDGDVERALAAYNAGPATVARYNGVPPFRETRQYVRKVLAIYRGHSEKAWKKAGWGRDPFVALPVKSAG